MNDAAHDAAFFENYGVNPFIDTEDDHLSSFAVDADTAASTVSRRFVTDGGYLPDPDPVGGSGTPGSSLERRPAAIDKQPAGSV